jgi:hypothetical protein
MATQISSRFGWTCGSCALLFLFLFASPFGGVAGAASSNPSSAGPLTPVTAGTAAGAPVAAAAPRAAAATGTLGLCQCISDRKKLDFSCPGSAQACQSDCGQRFAFSPQVECRLDRH